MIPFAVSGGHTINAINEYPTSKPTLLTVVLLTTVQTKYSTSPRALRRIHNLNDSFVISGSHTINAMNDDPTSKLATGCVVDHGPDILLHLELSGEGDQEVCPFRSAPHQHLLCFCQCE